MDHVRGYHGHASLSSNAIKATALKSNCILALCYESLIDLIDNDFTLCCYREDQLDTGCQPDGIDVAAHVGRV